MANIVSQFAIALALAAHLLPGAAQAQPAYVPTRKLEARWEIELQPAPGRHFDFEGTRLRAQADGRISLALLVSEGAIAPLSGDNERVMLMTVGGDGQPIGRVPVTGPGDRNYSVASLPGGDFLVHVEEDEHTPGMSLRRIGPDGTVHGVWTQAIDPQPHSRLLDAIAWSDGPVVAAVSIGPGPNDVLSVLVLGPGERPSSDHRVRLLLPGDDMITRIHPRSGSGEEKTFDVLANGGVRPNRSPAGHFSLSMSLGGNIATAELPVDLGPELLLCSAMTPEGRTVLGLTLPDNDRLMLLRWLGVSPVSDPKQAVTMQRPVARAAACRIGLREDGSGAIWLAPRQLVAFAPDDEFVWRASFDADAIAASWMPDGDVVALHATDSGVRLVRYSPR